MTEIVFPGPDDLSEQELIASLLAVAAESEDERQGALTTRDLSRATGHSEKWVRARLEMLFEAGRIENVTVTRRNINGVMTPRPAYRLVGD